MTMTQLDMIEELQEALKGTFLAGCRLGIENGKVYLGYDFDEHEDGDSWDEYIDVQEQLNSLGYRLVDTYCEHDYVGGTVEKL